jgi:hypothetical protein
MSRDYLPRDHCVGLKCAQVNYNVEQPSGGPASHEMIPENNIQAQTQNLPLRVHSL